jgi:hypothetical protein
LEVVKLLVVKVQKFMLGMMKHFEMQPEMDTLNFKFTDYNAVQWATEL